MKASRQDPTTPEGQAAVLRQGVRTWNLWRSAHPDVPVSVAGQSFADLDLTEVNLRQADLARAVFRNVVLDGADFTHATMRGSRLLRSPCPSAVFNGVQLTHTPLPYLEAPQADFRGARFDGSGLLACADLRGACFEGVDLSEVNLRHARLREARFAGARLYKAALDHADLSDTNLRGIYMASASLAHADLERADLSNATLHGCDFSSAKMQGARLYESDLRDARFLDTDLQGAFLGGAWLEKAHFDRAKLQRSFFDGARLTGATFVQAEMAGTTLERANLTRAELRDAVLTGANLQQALLVSTDLRGADLQGAHVYGISAWDVLLSNGSRGLDLVITPPGVPQVVVDEIDVAQFTYLLLDNPNLRRVINTVSRRGVLILGRFTPERKAVLDALRGELRRLGYVPFLFDFDRPDELSVRETVLTLAAMSLLVIADLTEPASIPLELQMVIPQIEVPIAPIIAVDHKPFAMFADLYLQYRSDNGGHMLALQSYSSTQGL